MQQLELEITSAAESAVESNALVQEIGQLRDELVSNIVIIFSLGYINKFNRYIPYLCSLGYW